MLSFMTESTKDFQETKTAGSFGAGNTKNTFDSIYEAAYADLKSGSIDPMVDINLMIKNEALMESYKEKLLSQLKDDCEMFAEKYGEDGSRYSQLYDACSQMIDNCYQDMVLESTRVGALLPIKAVDFPIIIKQNLQLAAKDIIQTEVTPSPVIKKHIERRWVVDNKTGKRWEYPQCFFKQDFMEIYAAGKGYPIKAKYKYGTPEVEDYPSIDGGMFNFNIIDKLTDAVDPAHEFLSANTKIVNVFKADGTKIPVDMRINMADGTWLGGTIYDATGAVIDVITGTVDFTTGTTSISSASGVIKKVEFAGYLSNELNERTVTFDRTREEHEFKIEDGFRCDVPYSLEQLEDSKALLDIDLYKLTYNDLADILVQMEDSQILKFLDDEYAKWNGVTVDPLGFNSFIREQTFDCDSSTQTVALQSEYIQKMLKFYVDRFVIDLMDTAKVEDMTFVIYGNPRYISLLDPEVNWVVKSGDSVGGVKLNYSYGVMNAGGVKIQVVSTMKYPNTDQRKLRIIPYPLSKDQFTFKHYKYTSHILTAQNSGYRSAERPGGSYTYLMGTTRNTTAAIQGIQGGMKFLNTPFILN